MQPRWLGAPTRPGPVPFSRVAPAPAARWWRRRRRDRGSGHCARRPSPRPLTRRLSRQYRWQIDGRRDILGGGSSRSAIAAPPRPGEPCRIFRFRTNGPTRSCSKGSTNPAPSGARRWSARRHWPRRFPSPRPSQGRVFRSRLGLTADNAEMLRQALLDAARRHPQDIRPTESDRYGQRYVLDFDMSTPVGRAVVRSSWIVPVGQNVLRFVACYIR
jgi:hypothetical protein